MARQGDPEGTAGDPGERRDRGRREIGPRRRPEGVSGAALRCGARGGSGESPRGRRARKAAGGRAGAELPGTCWHRRAGDVQPRVRARRGAPSAGERRGRQAPRPHVAGGGGRGPPPGGWWAVRGPGSGPALRGRASRRPRRALPEPRRGPAPRRRRRFASLLFPSLPPRREAPGVAALTLARPPPAARRGAARLPRPGFPPLRLAWPRGGGAVAGRSRRSPALPAAAVAGSLPAGRGRGRPRGELGERSARGIARAAERAPITLCSHAPAPGRASVGAGQWAPARCGAGSQ